MKELKYPSKETIKRLTKELGLKGADKYTQDWEYEVVNLINYQTILIFLAIIFLFFITKITGCVSDENNIASDNCESEEIEFRERHIYNADEADKNLFLQYLNGEIPILHYEIGWEDGETIYKTVYFDEIRDSYYNDEIDYYNNHTCFYIVDMDGDGKQEYCYMLPAVMDIIKYNEETECFELWLEERYQQKPIGNGQMYSIDYHTDTSYSYYLYDVNANLIGYELYTIAPKGDENGKEYIEYSIWNEEEGNFDVVPEDIWNEETEYLFELIDNAPKPISYEELLEN